MKKTVCFITSLLTVAAFIFSGCGKEPSSPEPIVGSGTGGDLQLGIWLDDDTFRISAQGLVSEKHVKKAESIRHEMACTAAKMVAIHKVMNAFMGTNSKNIKAEKTGRETFRGTIRNGTVVEETFDDSANTCQVIYEVKESSLRKTVEKNQPRT